MTKAKGKPKKEPDEELSDAEFNRIMGALIKVPPKPAKKKKKGKGRT